MRVALISDLHTEVWPVDLSFGGGADLIVFAGDVGAGAAGVREAARLAGGARCVYVPGNHEYYKGELTARDTEMRAAAEELGVELLQMGSVECCGVKVVGCTMWTDYRIGEPKFSRELAMVIAEDSINDHRRISLGSRRFTAQDALDIHESHVAWLRGEIEPGRTLVVTHHAPSPLSIATKYHGDPLNAAFSSDLSGLIESSRPLAWLHGHTHDPFDYYIGPTRVACNPRGYPRERFRDFKFAPLIIDIEPSVGS